MPLGRKPRARAGCTGSAQAASVPSLVLVLPLRNPLVHGRFPNDRVRPSLPRGSADTEDASGNAFPCLKQAIGDHIRPPSAARSKENITPPPLGPEPLSYPWWAAVRFWSLTGRREFTILNRPVSQNTGGAWGEGAEDKGLRAVAEICVPRCLPRAPPGVPANSWPGRGPSRSSSVLCVSPPGRGLSLGSREMLGSVTAPVLSARGDATLGAGKAPGPQALLSQPVPASVPLTGHPSVTPPRQECGCGGRGLPGNPNNWFPVGSPGPCGVSSRGRSRE